MREKKVLSIFAGLLSLLLISQVSCADVNWSKKPYWNNSKGLNDQMSATEIDDAEASDIQNIVFDTGGAIKKRYGYTSIPVDSPQKVSTGTVVCVNGLSFYKKNDGSRYLVAITNNDAKAVAMEKAYQTGGGTEPGAWHNIEGSQLPASYSNNYPVVFTIAQDWLVFTLKSLTDVKPFVWKGTGGVSYLTTDANIPASSLCAYHKNQLFLSGNSTNPSRVWFSNLADITTWTITDFFDVSTSDGSGVTGLLSAYDALYIFKDKSIWRLSGDGRDTFQLQKMVDGIGTLSQNSIKIVNNFIYFTTSQNDIAVYDGAYTVQFLSQKIRNTIGGLNFTRAGNNQGLAFSTYKYRDQDYYASVSSAASAGNDTVLLFDTAYKAWTKFSGISANAWCVGDNNLSQDTMYFGDTSGYVHQYPSADYVDGQIASNAITAFYTTKWFRYPEEGLGDKYWRVLKTYTLSEPTTTNLMATCSSDYTSNGKTFTLPITGAGSLWDVAVWDVDIWGGQSLIVNRSEVELGKSMFQVKFSNADLSKGFTIFGWENFIEKTSQAP